MTVGNNNILELESCLDGKLKSETETKIINNEMGSRFVTMNNISHCMRYFANFVRLFNLMLVESASKMAK